MLCYAMLCYAMLCYDMLAMILSFIYILSCFNNTFLVWGTVFALSTYLLAKPFLEAKNIIYYTFDVMLCYAILCYASVTYILSCITL